jgi:hypothetical protein
MRRLGSRERDCDAGMSALHGAGGFRGWCADSGSVAVRCSSGSVWCLHTGGGQVVCSWADLENGGVYSVSFCPTYDATRLPRALHIHVITLTCTHTHARTDTLTPAPCLCLSVSLPLSLCVSRSLSRCLAHSLALSLALARSRALSRALARSLALSRALSCSFALSLSLFLSLSLSNTHRPRTHDRQACLCSHAHTRARIGGVRSHILCPPAGRTRGLCCSRSDVLRAHEFARSLKSSR